MSLQRVVGAEQDHIRIITQYILVEQDNNRPRDNCKQRQLTLL